MPVNRVSRFGMDGDPHLGQPPMTDPSFAESMEAPPQRPTGVPAPAPAPLPPRQGLSPLMTLGLLGLAGLGAWWFLKKRKEGQGPDEDEDEEEDEEEVAEDEEPDEEDEEE